MSIFKSTLKPVIAAQLKARESIVSQWGDSKAVDAKGNPIYKELVAPRDSKFLQYVAGKNSWVRMISFVNYDSKIYSAKTGKLVNDGKYTGDQLAKKYVLEGGTLYQGSSLRSGVGESNSVYGSDLDFNNASRTTDTTKVLGINRPLGLRPMPGITGVTVTNKSAYGSLREATVQFMAWDKQQLEELEILFMRTGYSVLLEWGWSQYIDHKIPTNLNDYPEVTGITTFTTKTIDPFSANQLTDNLIYTKIDSDIETTKGNYDAILGYVKNFSWQLMPNGGFQCSTTLISRGEIIETLKASGNPNIILGSSYTPPSLSSVPPKPVLSNFEKIFLNIIGKINESEWVKSYSFGGGNIQGELYISGSTTDDQKILRDQADAVYADIKTRLIKNVSAYIKGPWNNYTVDTAGGTGIDLDTQVIIKLSDGKTQGTGIEYISMNAFIAIINEFFIYKNKKNNKPAVSIAIPYNTPCLASIDSVSIDPTTCLIQNSRATFITDKANGFSPVVYSQLDTTSLTLGASATPASISKFEFLAPGTTSVGLVGNIFVSMSKIIQLYRSLYGGPDGVDIIQLLQEVLDAVSLALGGINDFKLYTDRNFVQIIDAKYLENSGKNGKFKFDLIGLKSICRDVKINSRIFAEQSTMIAIGAGTTGDSTGNLGDIYSSTQTYFNRGLTDRIMLPTFDDPTAPATLTLGATVISGSDVYYYNIFKNLESLSSYLNVNVLGKPTGGSGWMVTSVPQENEVINAGSLLKTMHYQLNGSDVDFKALIPFELEITLDGIGGLVIGQIFTIDKSILPRDYYNKNLGFIITGINHNLQNNDWTTTVRTQICLLDNDKITDKYIVDKSKLKSIISAARVDQAKNGYLLCAIADYMVNQYTYIVSKYKNNDTSQPKEPSFDFPLVGHFASGIDNFINTYGTGASTYIKQILDFYYDTASIEYYLRNWHAVALSKYGGTAPNFPADYNTFITPSGGGNSSSLYTAISEMLFFDAAGNATAIRNGNITVSTLQGAFAATYFKGIQNELSISTFTALTTVGTDTDDISIIDHIDNRKINASTLHVNTKMRDIGTGTNYKFPANSFDSLFLTFYNYLIKNASTNRLPGLSIYGGPVLSGGVGTSTANFRVIRFEKPQ
jgi:hypothetical protein